LELDHVLIAVTDLAAAAREIHDRYGLVSVEGGRHPGWGTANRIVPLGDAYLELIAVVDEAEAAQSPFGGWVSAEQPTPIRLLGWAVRTQDLDAVARRLALPIGTGSRAGRDRTLLTWRFAGVDQAIAEPSLPFFIEWGHGTPFPGRAPAAHREGRFGVARLELRGDAERLAVWLGSHRLPVTISPGASAVTRIVLAGAAGEIALSETGS
jgi:hypothetical protein